MTNVVSDTATPEAEQDGTEYGAQAVGYKVTVRLQLPKSSRLLDEVLEKVEAAGGQIGGTATVSSAKDAGSAYNIRDVMIITRGLQHAEEVVNEIRKIKDVVVGPVSDDTFLMHIGGKISIAPVHHIRSIHQLGMVYTPNVARVSDAIFKDPKKARSLTIKGKMTAVITDGSRVLALGNIGPLAAMPVMEGKCALFKQFGNVDAFPICLDTQDTEEIIKTIKFIAPVFGAINLEDIASPRCYEVEERLKKELNIPIFHDDQHGTAIAVAAATKNAARLTKKRLSRMKVVVVGVGAAGMACAKMLIAMGVKNLIGFNKDGAVYCGRNDLTEQERWLAANSNPKSFKGSIEKALKGADMVLGLSAAGSIKAEWLAKMKKNAICFALANPIPEVLPKDAKPYVAVMATGGSNYKNQINNALVFPGIFRGALDAQVTEITYEMQLEAAHALAAVVSKEELDYDKIIPAIFEEAAHEAVAEAVRRVAKRNGLGRYAQSTRDTAKS
jgi:malate dehydrogenase (oxaloacetate-decarboxylating)